MQRQYVIGIVVLLIIVIAIGVYMYKKKHPGAAFDSSPIGLNVNNYQVTPTGAVRVGVVSSSSASLPDPSMLIGRDIVINLSELGQISSTVKQATHGPKAGVIQVMTQPGATTSGAVKLSKAAAGDSATIV
jgi:hypothetical protein